MQLKEFIKSLPQGLDTALFQKEKKSSSNAQKLLLARSIISRPKILFYEDPTDNMDDKVANEIIDFITAKSTNGPLLYHQKSVLEEQV
jgi:ABC-type multidrug transport system fused ATPase/permease subunit